MTVNKVITFLFITLILTNLVHNAIPHHHHMGNTQAHECCGQHECDMNEAESWDPCTHCEAFNGMEYYPITINNKIEPLKHTGSDFFNLQVSLPDLDASCACDVFAFSDPPDLYRGPDRKILSLRGPPTGC